MNLSDQTSEGRLERVNRESTERSRRIYEQAREGLMLAAYGGFLVRLQEDSNNLERLSKETAQTEDIPFYVDDVVFRIGEEEVKLLSLKLERNKALDQPGEDILYIYIPNPEGFDHLEEFVPGSLPRPEVVYFERVALDEEGKEKVVAQYGVTEDTFFEFETQPGREQQYRHYFDNRTDVPEEGLTLDSGELLVEALRYRINPRNAELISIFNDTVNMKTVPQVIFPAA